VPGDIEVEFAAANVVEIKGRSEDGFAPEMGPASTLPRGLMMALPPRITIASGESPSDTRTVSGKSFLRRN
jgi:hypothetical protein